MSSADQGPKEQGYRTPPTLARELALRWAGSWTIDVAADDDGRNALAPAYRCPLFSAFDPLPWSIGIVDGEPIELRETEERVHVWCNPPFQEILPWVERAEAEVRAGHIEVACLLLPVRAGQRWWPLVSDGGLWSLDWIDGRVSFINPKTGVVDKNPREAYVAAVCRRRLVARCFR